MDIEPPENIIYLPPLEYKVSHNHWAILTIVITIPLFTICKLKFLF